MIGKAKAISHGINNLRYIMGESKNKKHPEKIDFICCQHLPPGLDAMGVCESMQATTAGMGRLKNTLIQIELSPPKEYTNDFRPQDWQQLWYDFIREFDRQTIRDKNGKVTSRQTCLAGSKAVVYKHDESKGGIPHLHAGVCRVDEDGHVNNDHDIHLRAQRAAEAVARRRGWTTAMDVRTGNVQRIASICQAVLMSMPTWSWSEYVARIESPSNGQLRVKARTDSLGRVRGYSVIDGDAKYKASELGRSLTCSRLYATWQKLHRPEPTRQPHNPVAVTPVAPKPVSTKPETVYPVAPKPVTANPVPANPAPLKPMPRPMPAPDYTVWSPDHREVEVAVQGSTHRLFIPKDVCQLFDDEFDYREVVNFQPLTNLACAYFAALLCPDVPVASGGGGSSTDSDWGRDKDETDLQFARRCARMARLKLGIVKKPRRFHR